MLDDLQRGATYHGRAVGLDRDGREYFGNDYTWVVAPPTPPPTRAETISIPLTVANPHVTMAKRWPITTGVPVPRGELADTEHVRLIGPDGEVPAEIQLAGRWPDGSVRWLFVTFVADVAAEASVEYQLEYGQRRAAQTRPPVPSK